MPQTLSSLPTEIFIVICEHLPLPDLARLVRTSTSCAWAGSPRIYDTLFFTDNISLFSHLRGPISQFESHFIADYFDKRADRLLATRRYNGRNILHELSQYGNIYLLDILLAKGVDVSVKDYNGLTPLHEALRENQEGTATRLIDAGADLLTPVNGRPILAYVDNGASEAFMKKLVAAIQAAGGDLSECAPDGHTALHYASRAGNSGLVRILVANGADVLANNKYDHIPLVHSVLHTHDEASKILLNALKFHPRGYDINEPIGFLNEVPENWPRGVSFSSVPGYTILHYAIHTWNVSTIELLLNYEANPIAQSNPSGEADNITPFDIAIRGRCPELVAVITGMRIPPDFWPSTWAIQDGFETSVREAYPGTVRIICELYKQGKLRIDLASASQKMIGTCTYYGAHRPYQDINNTVIYVIDAGGDVNAQDQDGETCLHKLCAWGSEYDEARLELAKYILNHGADWRLRNSEGETVLHKAIRVEQLENYIRIIAQSLLPDLRTPSSDSAGQTTLHSSTLKLLRDAGFDPNAANNMGQTLAHLAMRPDVSEELLAYLAELGVDLSLSDNEGRPPIHYAATERWLRGQDREDVIKYLVRREECLHPGCDECKVAIQKIFKGGSFLL
ncbi:ankyrin repeat-containing domain protein [Aspergillus insuetus]